MKNTNNETNFENIEENMLSTDVEHEEHVDGEEKPKTSFFSKFFGKKKPQKPSGTIEIETATQETELENVDTEEKVETSPKKAGMFSKIFAKKSEKSAIEPEQKEQKQEQNKAEPKDETEMVEELSGNAFTNMFKKDSPEKNDDFIGTIIETAKDEDENKFSEITNQFNEEQDEEEKVEEKEKKEIKLFHVAQFVAMISFLVPVISFSFYWVQLGEDNIVANSFNLETPGKILKSNQEKIEQEKEEIEIFEEKQKDYEAKKENLTNNKILADIIDKRINWLGVIKKIEDITEQHFQASISDSVIYSAYSGKSSESEISIQGEVRDDSGKSMTQLVKLIESLNKDAYFEGAEVRNFSKREDIEKGTFVTSFNLTFDYVPDPMLIDQGSLKATE